ncbi:MAG: hypothetical protein HUK11_06000 [Muribaculaceae bacterium]|nr:hypothetical protein [Muribaculaceae bacterium]
MSGSRQVKEIRDMFILNDLFRFRRELFQGSADVMNDTLDLVQKMESAEEADAYFLGQLEWNEDSEEVKDFMEIVHRYFA